MSTVFDKIDLDEKIKELSQYFRGAPQEWKIATLQVASHLVTDHGIDPVQGLHMLEVFRLTAHGHFMTRWKEYIEQSEEEPHPPEWISPIEAQHLKHSFEVFQLLYEPMLKQMQAGLAEEARTE